MLCLIKSHLPVLTQEKVYDRKVKVLQGVTGFDRSQLKKTVTVVKNVIPTKEGFSLHLSIEHDA